MAQGERVKEIRKSLNLTLEKFGEKLGVGKTAISKIEKEERSLTEQMAKAICREYHVSYDFLIYGEGEMFDSLPETILDELCIQYDLNDFDRALVEMYISFPEDCRKLIKKEMLRLLQKVDPEEESRRQDNPDQPKNGKGN